MVISAIAVRSITCVFSLGLWRSNQSPFTSRAVCAIVISRISAIAPKVHGIESQALLL
jgi:hypothetical protein